MHANPNNPTRIQYLGFDIDTIKTTVKVPHEKWELFKVEVAAIRKRHSVPLKQLEKVQGKMTSFALVLSNIRLWIRECTTAILSAVDDVVRVSEELREELLVWL